MKSSLAGINAKSTFKNVSDFKKLKIIYYWDNIFCYDYKYLPFSNKPYQPEMKFIEKFMKNKENKGNSM